MMKKIFLGLMVCLFVLAASNIWAQCPGRSIQFGDYCYTVSYNKVTIEKYTGRDKVVIIPASIDGMPVTRIDDYAFLYCRGLTSVTIPDSVTSLGWRVFEGNFLVDSNNSAYSSLDGVLYNKDKTVLYRYPRGKRGGFTIPDSVTTVWGGAFFKNNRLTSVTIPDSVITINGSAFKMCSNLTSVIIGKSVTRIGDSAFDTCSRLERVYIPNSVTSIGKMAFQLCDIANLSIGNSVTTIGDDAFSFNSLTRVTIPASVTTIGDYAFRECYDLSVAYFLGNAPSMGKKVFWSPEGFAINFKIWFSAETSGFTAPLWEGYPAEARNPK